ncbi:unnamed protein product [Rotaria socialis]|uniref:TLC domain-containing protein n=1 Tax=Rotaria socialis TaxID=392032 RepID=A0A818PLI9_9BILA|nr:unnamed protein product [Rotaria socialis]
MHTTTFSDEDYRVQYLGTNPSLRLPIWYMILFSFLGHSLLFYCLPTSITPFIKSYIISTVHACVSVLAVSIFYGRGLIDFTQVNKILGGGMAGTPDETMTYSICYSSGYFIYDLLIMLWFKSVRTPSAIAHHIIILVAGLAGLYTHVAHASHFFMLAEELSTIPLNLKTIYHKRTRLHDLFAHLFIVAFFFSRLIYGTIICSYTFRAVPIFIQMASTVHDTSSIAFVIAQVFLFIFTRLLNLYWTILIIRKLFVAFRSKRSPVLTNDMKLKKKAL